MSKLVIFTAPVYNIKKSYLDKVFKSFMNQTYENWELIFVDDGSKKETADYLDLLASKDNRIKIIHQKNAGVVEARRTGFRAMKNADYAATVDPDDYLPDDAIELLVNAAEKHHADLVIGEAQKVLGNKKLKYKPNDYFPEERAFSKSEIINELLISYFGLNRIPVTVWGKLYSKKFIPILAEGEIVNTFIATDSNASLNVIPHSEKAVYINKSVYCYRTGGGTSKFRADYIDEVLNYYRYRLPFIDKYLKDFSKSGLSAYDFIALELKNETCFYLKSYLNLKTASNEEAVKMIKALIETPEIAEAFENHEYGKRNYEYNLAMKNKDSGKVLEILKKEVDEENKKNRLKNIVKKIVEKV